MIVTAGVMLGSPFEESVPADWSTMIDVNIHGLLNTAQTFIDALLDAAAAGRRADLILIGAISANHIYPSFSVHAATSAAVTQFARTLRAEYGSRGLRVHTIELGYARTQFGAGMHDSTARDVWTTLESTVRPLEPGVVAEIVALTAAMPPGVNIAEMVLVPTEQD